MIIEIASFFSILEPVLTKVTNARAQAMNAQSSEEKQEKEKSNWC